MIVKIQQVRWVPNPLALLEPVCDGWNFRRLYWPWEARRLNGKRFSGSVRSLIADETPCDGIRWQSFENLSTMTKMHVCPSHGGRSVMKSTPRCDQSWLESGRGRSLPDVKWWGVFGWTFCYSAPSLATRKKTCSILQVPILWPTNIDSCYNSFISFLKELAHGHAGIICVDFHYKWFLGIWMSEEGICGKGLFEELKRLVGFRTPGNSLGVAFQEGCERSGDGAVILTQLLVEVGEVLEFFYWSECWPAENGAQPWHLHGFLSWFWSAGLYWMADVKRTARQIDLPYNS